MIRNRMVAVCDILGFSRLVEIHSLDVVVEKSLGWFLKALYHSIHKDGFPDSVPDINKLDTHPDIGVSWFSDTVLFYTLRDDDECVRSLLSTVAWLIFETIVSGRTIIRGGLSYGECYIDSKSAMFVGSPIIQAYSLEKNQEWAGASLTESAVNRIPEQAQSGRYADWWVTPYSVPLKEGGPMNTLAVAWTEGIHGHSWRMSWSEDREEPNDADWEARPDICRKFRNTKAFHDKTCRCRGI